jgi:7,8-dihydropterin-6-yl-methyl-4-(beta-D-ribofuranosyl)aminobenzene 5'-phosphate synthase
VDGNNHTIKTNNTMLIYILTDNCAGGHFLAEHGLSWLIEIDDQKILFDTGHSDVFLKNAEKMSIHVKDDVGTIVLSHGHWDHGDGLQYLGDKRLIVHPKAFMHRFRKRDFSPVGLSLSKKEVEKRFELKETTAPLQLTEHLFFLGEIPRKTSFEAKTTPFADDFRNDDFVPDDSALAAVVEDSLVVISGCAHSGICNIVEQAKKVTGISKVMAVMGGFHLKAQDEQTLKTIEYLKENRIEQVYPSHCTELPALAAFYNAFQNQQLKTGMLLEF